MTARRSSDQATRRVLAECWPSSERASVQGAGWRLILAVSVGLAQPSHSRSGARVAVAVAPALRLLAGFQPPYRL